MTEPQPPAAPSPPAAPPAAAARPATTQPEEARNIMAYAAGAGRASETGLSADEEAELARLQAKALDARRGEGGTIQMRVTSGHSEVTYGGHRVTQEWTDTPAWLAGAFASQAAESGVELEQREES